VTLTAVSFAVSRDVCIGVGRRFLTVLLLFAGSLCVPGLAAGQSTNAPPGNSGIDEYLEVVPEGGGNRPIEGTDSGGSPLSPAAKRGLLAQGNAGRGAAALAEGTGPSRPQRKESRRADVTSTPEGQTAARAAVTRAVGGSDAAGLGFWLPIVLAGVVLVLGATALLRRRPAQPT
jgi:hypothetical protein